MSATESEKIIRDCAMTIIDLIKQHGEDGPALLAGMRGPLSKVLACPDLTSLDEVTGELLADLVETGVAAPSDGDVVDRGRSLHGCWRQLPDCDARVEAKICQASRDLATRLRVM